MNWLPIAIIKYFTGTQPEPKGVAGIVQKESNWTFYIVAGLIFSSIIIFKKWQ